MAVLFMDDFGGYGSTPNIMLAGIYAGFAAPGFTVVPVSPGLALDPSDPALGRVLQCGPVGQNPTLNVRKVLDGGGVTTIGIMCRIWYPSLPAAGSNAITVMSDGSAYLYSLRVNSAGYLEIRSGSYNGSVIYISELPKVTAGNWLHIEWKIVIHPTDGSFEVRVEGLPVPGLVQTEIDTGSTAVAQVGFMQTGGGGGSTHTYYVKDFVIWDDSGSDVTDFIGTCLLHGHDLTADEALNWFLEGGATGVEILNNDPPDPNEYIYARDDPLPDPYQASISPLPDDITSVKAVQVRYMCAKNDGGDAEVQASMISDPEDTPAIVNGAARVASVSQTFYWDIFHRDPSTDAPWLPYAVDRAWVQLNRLM